MAAVGLLGEAAVAIREHLTSRTSDQRIGLEYEAMWCRRFLEVWQARQQLRVLSPSHRHDRHRWPVRVEDVRGPWERRTREGTIRWGEWWASPHTHQANRF
jgi:hypothetical protein